MWPRKPWSLDDLTAGNHAGTTPVPAGWIPGTAANDHSDRIEAMKLENLDDRLSGMSCWIPSFPGTVTTGFPSPTNDYMNRKLDLNERLIKHPAVPRGFI